MLRRILPLLVAVAIAGGEARAETPALDPAKIRFQLHEGPPGAETIVLVHGLGATRRSFDKVAGELSKRFRVLVYDQRGHGGTKGEGLDYSTEVMARDLEGLRAHLKLGPVHVVGHSMGARTAVRYAAMFPQHVKSVVVEDMAFQPRKPADPAHQETIRQRAIALRQVAHDEAGSREEIHQRLKSFIDDGDAPWPWKAIDQGSMPLSNGRFRLGGFPEAQLLWQHQAGSEDMGAALAAIRAPLMVLEADLAPGRKPPVIDAAGRAHIQKHRPGTPIVRVPNATHSIHTTQADDYAQLVDLFVSGSGQAPAWMQTAQREGLLRARQPRASRVRWSHENPRARFRAVRGARRSLRRR